MPDFPKQIFQPLHVQIVLNRLLIKVGLYIILKATAAAGDITGDGINRIFFIAKPDYTLMIAETQLVGNDKVLYDSTYKAGTGNTIYITDDRGVTLYRFSKDTANTNTFTKSDFSNDATFPIVQISSIQSLPSTLDKTAFSSITVFGKTQLTYKGWPLYRFGSDSLDSG